MTTAPLAKAAQPKTLHLQGGPQGVLLLHGLSSSPLELQYLARHIHKAGYTVRVPAMAGYTSGLKQGGESDVDDWVNIALHEFDQLRSQCTSVSVGGLCLGSVLALRVAALRWGDVKSLLCLSTSLHYDGWGNPILTPLLPLARYTPFARRIRVREKSPFGLKDTRMRAWVERQMREAGESDAGAATLLVGDLLEARSLIALSRSSLGAITCPILLIHAKEDENATPRSSFEVASRVSSSTIRVVLLSDSYHMISIDQEKDLVLCEMLQFLKNAVVADRRVDVSKPAKLIPLR